MVVVVVVVERAASGWYYAVPYRTVLDICSMMIVCALFEDLNWGGRISDLPPLSGKKIENPFRFPFLFSTAPGFRSFRFVSFSFYCFSRVSERANPSTAAVLSVCIYVWSMFAF